jgi:hypothetical protein
MEGLGCAAQCLNYCTNFKDWSLTWHEGLIHTSMHTQDKTHIMTIHYWNGVYVLYGILEGKWWPQWIYYINSLVYASVRLLRFRNRGFGTSTDGTFFFFFALNCNSKFPRQQLPFVPSPSLAQCNSISGPRSMGPLFFFFLSP